MSSKSPDENIMQGQKQKMLNKIKDNKKDSIINNIGDELLQ